MINRDETHTHTQKDLNNVLHQNVNVTNQQVSQRSL